MEANGILKKSAILLIKAYQYTLSSMIGWNCRFYPSCSRYTIESIEKYGIIKGSAKGLVRILKCHPFCTGGYDPVK